MLAEPLRYVTLMTRCDHCGMAFPSACQKVVDAVTPDDGRSYTETCPAGHVRICTVDSYYLV
jgi:hypothetical protein